MSDDRTSAAAALLAQLGEQQQQPEEFAAGWRCEDQPDIAGRVTRTNTRAGEYGEYPVVTIVMDDGEHLAIHCTTTVLKEDIGAVAQVGDTIAVKYLGLVETKDGKRQFKKFICAVERAAAAATTSDIPSDDFAPAVKEASTDDIPF